VLAYIQGGTKWPLTWPMAQALVMIYLELGIITSVAMVFSSFSSPTLSAIFTLCFVVIGRLTAGIRTFGERAESDFFRYGAEVLYYVVPNLNNYIQIETALYGQGLGWLLFLRIMAAGILTCAFFLVAAIPIFQKRNFV